MSIKILQGGKNVRCASVGNIERELNQYFFTIVILCQLKSPIKPKHKMCNKKIILLMNFRTLKTQAPTCTTNSLTPSRLQP